MKDKVFYRFSVIRPGGNDTALINGIPGDLQTRKRLNDAIMGVYPNVEQVGFVNLDPNDPELMMAGGEFCGNATRSAAWEVLKREPGELEIKVSGAGGRLKAGVSEDGEAYAQMPVYNDVSYIQRDPKKPTNYTVTMKGITHYVDFNTEQISGLTESEIKKKVRVDLRKRKLDELPAAGIIFAEKKGVKDYKITPVVYVRDMDTLFVETACGSGTAALGLAIAKESGLSVSDLPIYQPSGLPIKVSAEYDGSKIGYTQIQSPLSQVDQGVIEDGEVIKIV